jgi:hypothetical protein
VTGAGEFIVTRDAAVIDVSMSVVCFDDEGKPEFIKTSFGI